MKSDKDKGGICAGYRRQIVDMVEKIENINILIKILTFINVWLE